MTMIPRRPTHTVARATWGAACFLMVPNAFAQQEPAAQQSVQAGYVSVASLDKLAQEAQRENVELPAFLTAAGIEQNLPFLAPDGLQADAPLGVAFYATPNWNPQSGQGVVFILPAKPGAAPISTFTNAGGTAVPGHPDSVQLQGTIFRRTATSFLFGMASDLSITTIDPAFIGEAYQGKPADAAGGLIAHGVLHVKNLRDIDPTSFNKFLDSATSTAEVSSGPAKIGADFVKQYFVDWLQKWEDVSVSLSRSDQTFDLQTTVQPAQLPAAAGTFHAAGMPADVAATLQIAAPFASVVPGVDQAFGEALKAGSPDDKSQQPGGDDPYMSFAHATEDLLLGGQAISMGFEPKGTNGGVLFVVQQGAAPLDARVKDWGDSADAFAKAIHANPNDKPDIVEHFKTNDGLDATRIRVLDNGQTQVLVEAAEKDGKTYMVFMAEEGPYLDQLLAQPEEGPMDHVIDGKVKLDQVMDLGKQIGGASMPWVSDPTWADAAKGQVATISAGSENNSVVLDVNVPESLVKQAMHLLLPPSTNPS